MFSLDLVTKPLVRTISAFLGFDQDGYRYEQYDDKVFLDATDSETRLKNLLQAHREESNGECVERLTPEELSGELFNI